MSLAVLLAAAVIAAPVPPEKVNAVALAASSLDYCVMNATRTESLARKGPLECVGWGERDCLDDLQSDALADIALCAAAERDAWVAKVDAMAEALAAAAPSERAAARLRAAQAAWVRKRERTARPGLAGARATSKLCADRYGYLAALANG